MRRNSSLCLDRCEAGSELEATIRAPKRNNNERNKNANSNGCKHGKSFRHFSGSDWKEREKSGVFSIYLDTGIVQFFPLASSELFWLHLLSFTLYFAAFSLAPYRPAYLLSLFFCFYFYLSIPLAFSRSLPASLWRGISFARLLMYPEIGSDTVVFIFPFFAFLISRFLPLCFLSFSFEEEIFLFDFFAIERYSLWYSRPPRLQTRKRDLFESFCFVCRSTKSLSVCMTRFLWFRCLSMSSTTRKPFSSAIDPTTTRKGRYIAWVHSPKKPKRERRRAANGLHKSSVHSVVCNSGDRK